jgi:hypothetical protein
LLLLLRKIPLLLRVIRFQFLNLPMVASATITSAAASSTHTTHTYSSSSGVQRDTHARIKRSESAKRDFMRQTGTHMADPGKSLIT